MDEFANEFLRNLELDLIQDCLSKISVRKKDEIDEVCVNCYFGIHGSRISYKMRANGKDMKKVNLGLSGKSDMDLMRSLEGTMGIIKLAYALYDTTCPGEINISYNLKSKNLNVVIN